MKYIKSLFLIVFVALSFIGQAQDLPFEEYGFSPKVVTLSNGKYQEFHDLETVVEIGSVLYNTETKQIVGFAESKELNLEDIQPYLVNRWVSPDPLSESYASLSPYNYVNNNPIRNIDPDGRYFESIIDIGFILYDVGEIAYDYITKGEVNPISVAALGADVVCLAAPIATGGGLAVRAGKEGVEQVAKHAAKEVATEGAEKMVKESGEKAAKGGAYKDLVVETGKQERHHIPSNASTNLSKGDGPSIVMDKVDHKKTASWGNSKEAQQYRAKQTNYVEKGEFNKAQQMDVQDIQSKFGDKYNEHLQQMFNNTGGGN